jgi:hypothetical protein
VDTGWPALAGLSVQEFVALVEPLRHKASDLETATIVAVERETEEGSAPKSQTAGQERAVAPQSQTGQAAGPSPDAPIPFVLVVTSGVVTADRALPTVHWRSTTGWTEYSADELAHHAPIDGVEVPHHAAYLVTEVDTGRATLDVRAKDAVPIIEAGGRSPLTVDEGVSLLALFPGILKDRNAFFLPGSRDATKRVAALWVSKGHPRLGWCWEGNPHTWLGSASCAARVA